MINYRKGNQAAKLDDLPLQKINLGTNGDYESIWVLRGTDYVVLQNTAVCFMPFPSWGVVLPLTKPLDGLELHPEAWDQYLERGTIDPEGNFIVPEEDK